MRSLLVEITIWSFGKLPLSARVLFGRFLGFVFRRIWRFRADVILSQLQLAFPELSDSERHDLAKKHYRHLGLLVGELVKQPTLTPAELSELCSVSGLENLEAAHAKGRGVLVLAGHYGNWELGLARAGQLGYPAYAVVKEIKGAAGQYLAARLRTTHDIGMIPRRQSLKKIVQALKSGSLIGFVLDQNMTEDEGIFVDFFGKPACTMAGLAVMASRYDVPVVPISIHRDEDERRHHVAFLPEVPWEEPPPGSADSATHYNTRRYTAVIEDIIRAHPDQWLWIHRRWKTQPSAPSLSPNA